MYEVEHIWNAICVHGLHCVSHLLWASTAVVKYTTTMLWEYSRLVNDAGILSSWDHNVHIWNHQVHSLNYLSNSLLYTVGENAYSRK